MHTHHNLTLNNPAPGLTPDQDRHEPLETPLSTQWILQQHLPLRHTLVRHYHAVTNTQGAQAANQWLSQAHRRLRLGRTGLWLHSDEQALEDYAQAKARGLTRALLKARHHTSHYASQAPTTGDEQLARVRTHLHYLGLPFPPLPDNPTDQHKAAALARTTDPLWWRKQLRLKQWREMETFNRDLGLVSRHRGIYLSDLSFTRRCQQKQRNRRLLASLQAENEQGQTYTLAELAELSVANPINRRHELMVRLRGFETFAQQAPQPWQAVLFTLTCPSKYHAVLARSAQPNPAFNGATPRQANDYLNTLWQRTRAAWDRQGIETFGFRVAEPHHDGTPHWHLLLFFRSQDQLDRAQALLRDYALAEDGQEPGAQTQRFHAVPIDPNKGSATGYIAKYIAKNIDGFGLEADLYGRHALTSALRIEAWASLWGIRQFQQIGGPSVTVWRELRRLHASHLDPDLLAQLTRAADEGQWDRYTELMGGAVCKRQDRPLRPLMVVRQPLNRYAEPIKALRGLWFETKAVVTRLHTWVIGLGEVENPAAQAAKARGGDTPGLRLADLSPAVPPWSSVNNCTPGAGRAMEAKLG